MSATQKIVPCLWFDGNADEAAAFYVSLFEGSAIARRTRFGDQPAVVTVEFDLAGYRLVGLNGGPQFRFTPAISLFVTCETVEEIDRLWGAITAGGGAESVCGWLKDPFGVSWQVVPAELLEILGGPNGAAADRALQGMRKLDIDTLRAAR